MDDLVSAKLYIMYIRIQHTMYIFVSTIMTPKHQAKVFKWFKDNKIHVLNWPSQSPDLNRKFVES